jgi:transposase-like protein
VTNGTGQGRNMSDDTQGADGLPDTNVNVRWTARRKTAVLRAAAAGQITAEEIARRYAISPEELDTWSRDYAERGLFGLQEKGWMARRRRPPLSGGGDPQGRGARPSAPASRPPLNPAATADAVAD